MKQIIASFMLTAVFALSLIADYVEPTVEIRLEEWSSIATPVYESCTGGWGCGFPTSVHPRIEVFVSNYANEWEDYNLVYRDRTSFINSGPAYHQTSDIWETYDTAGTNVIENTRILVTTDTNTSAKATNTTTCSFSSIGEHMSVGMTYVILVDTNQNYQNYISLTDSSTTSFIASGGSAWTFWYKIYLTAYQKAFSTNGILESLGQVAYPALVGEQETYDGSSYGEGWYYVMLAVNGGVTTKINITPNPVAAYYEYIYSTPELWYAEEQD